jgi:transcriptional regulator of heat shock response
MKKQDLQQISNLLNQKLDQKFKENNKKIFKKINGVDEKVEKLLTTVKEEFDKNTEQHNEVDKRFNEVDKRFNKVDEELKKKATSQQVLSWGDDKIVALELDMDKVKYIHLDEWEKLPPTVEISKTLVEHKLKKKR